MEIGPIKLLSTEASSSVIGAELARNPKQANGGAPVLPMLCSRCSPSGVGSLVSVRCVTESTQVGLFLYSCYLVLSEVVEFRIETLILVEPTWVSIINDFDYEVVY